MWLIQQAASFRRYQWWWQGKGGLSADFSKTHDEQKAVFVLFVLMWTKPTNEKYNLIII
jgi:hypothetical protein